MEKIATTYAVRIAGAKDLDDLRRIADEIRSYLTEHPEFKEWREWLLDLFQSREDALAEPKLVPEEVLNKSGLKALEQKEITLDTE